MVGPLGRLDVRRPYLWAVRLACGVSVWALIAGPVPVRAEPVSLGDFGRLATRCAPGVVLSTLAAVARTESGFQPLMIHDNTTGVSSLAGSRKTAIRMAQASLRAGHSLDLGMMQINSANLAPYGLTLSAAFTPCRSMAVAAAILSRAYSGGKTHRAQQVALRIAISRYNTGNAQDGFVNGYVHKVELSAAQIVPELTRGPPSAVETATAAQSAGGAAVVRTLSNGRQTLTFSDEGTR
jgi:type IV secretion system protein VirB1